MKRILLFILENYVLQERGGPLELKSALFQNANYYQALICTDHGYHVFFPCAYPKSLSTWHLKNR